jgi:hypothetical protein
LKHENNGVVQLQSNQGFGQTLFITYQSAQSVDPADAAFDHPAPRRPNERFLCLAKVHRVQFGAFFLNCLHGLLSVQLQSTNGSFT